MSRSVSVHIPSLTPSILYYDTELQNRIKQLEEELKEVKQEATTHLDAIEVGGRWHEEQKQELQNRITELEQRLQLQDEPNSDNNETVDLETQIEVVKPPRVAQMK